MKSVLCVLLLVSCYLQGQSQAFDEWFKQKKTQTKYLLDQIAALKVYIDYGQKGYQIVYKGLTAIGDIKAGHLRLDEAFFRSLEIVSPSVRNYGKIAEIVSLEKQTVAQYHATLKLVNQSRQYIGKELDYIESVFSGLINYSTTVLEELITITSDGKLQMSDDERLRRIDKLYMEMQDGYAFSTQFRNECSVMAVQRARDRQDVLLMEKLHGLPN